VAERSAALEAAVHGRSSSAPLCALTTLGAAVCRSVQSEDELTPAVVVAMLDRFIVGQADAKRAMAVALRNRWRRRKVPSPLKEEVMPKNILMVGPTGCGKTEIARRLAKLTSAPFIKVRQPSDAFPCELSSAERFSAALARVNHNSLPPTLAPRSRSGRFAGPEAGGGNQIHRGGLLGRRRGADHQGPGGQRSSSDAQEAQGKDQAGGMTTARILQMQLGGRRGRLGCVLAVSLSR
jgi:hypothetical protein